MKKILTIIFLIASAQSFSQSTKIFNTLYNDGVSFGKKDTEIIYTTPKTPLFIFNGYGNFYASNTDSIGIEGSTNLWFTNARARAAISYSGQGYLSYNSTTGVLTGSQINLTTNVTNILPVANGGTGTSTPGIVAGTNITVTGTWPNQTVNSSGGGGGSGWSKTGDSLLSRTLNYIGSKDTSQFRIKTKAIDAIMVDSLQKTYFQGVSAIANSSDSAAGQFNYKGISWRRHDGLTRGSTLYLDASENLVLQGAGSGFYYKEGSTTEFSVTQSGVGTYAGQLTASKFISSAASGVAADFASANYGGTVMFPNNIQLGGTGYMYSTQGSGPTTFGIKFNCYDGTAYQDRWWIQQNGAFGNSATQVPSAVLYANSTTRGFLPPVQTTAQVNAGGVSTGTLVGGSGYTNGTYNNKYLTGGSGSGVYANFTITGGAVTAVTINYEGAGYVVGDVLSYSTGIGAGSGFTYTVSALTTPATGLMKYNSTTNTNNTYNGTNWTGQFVSSSAGTLTLTHGTDYVFTGTTATYTLPAISSTLLGRQNAIKIKNRGSGTITLNAASGSTIYSTSAVSTINIIAGAACELMPDGTYFLVMVNQ